MTDWIPVEKRLPEVGETVLVCSLGNIGLGWLINDWEWRNDGSSDYPPTHWMPLPDPPVETEA